jgi:hypothetical protein
MPVPVPASRRAPRRREIFRLIRQWLEEGPDPWERELLQEHGQSRWLARGRLTDQMIVLLLLHRQALLRHLAADRPPDPRDDRARMIEALMRLRGLMLLANRDLPDGSTIGEVEHCLRVLERLDSIAAGRFRAHLQAGGFGEGADDRTRAGMFLIHRNFPAVMKIASGAAVASRISPSFVALGDAPEALRFQVGEQSRLAADAQRLERELGARFLDPRATPSYRAARARKWKQAALAQQTPDQPSKRAMSPASIKWHRASRGVEREMAELRVLRTAPDLPDGDPRRQAYEERFTGLDAKQARRRAYRRFFLGLDPHDPQD